MRPVHYAAFASAAALLGASAPAGAVLIHFELSGLNTAHFVLDLNPVPSSFDGSSFSVDDPVGSFPGIASPPKVTFYVNSGTVSEPGGLFISGSGSAFFGGVGPQLFTGSTSAPTIKLGTFSLDIAFPTSEGGLAIVTPNAYTLITYIPEPESWALMVAGFGLAGGALRARPRRIVSPRSALA